MTPFWLLVWCQWENRRECFPKQRKGANGRQAEKNVCIYVRTRFPELKVTGSMRSERGCHCVELRNCQHALDMVVPPGSALQRFPQFAGEWCFVVPLNPCLLMGLGWGGMQRSQGQGSIVFSGTVTGQRPCAAVERKILVDTGRARCFLQGMLGGLWTLTALLASWRFQV